MTEQQLQRAVLDLARLHHWTCYHTWLSAHSAAGFPDILACKAGRLVVMELKSARGRLTEAQEQWLGLLGAVPGVEVFVFRPEHWLNGEVDRVLT